MSIPAILALPKHVIFTWSYRSSIYRVQQDGDKTLEVLKNGGRVNQNIKGCDASNSSGPHCFVVNLNTNNYSLYFNLISKTYYY